MKALLVTVSSLERTRNTIRHSSILGCAESFRLDPVFQLRQVRHYLVSEDERVRVSHLSWLSILNAAFGSSSARCNK